MRGELYGVWSQGEDEPPESNTLHRLRSGAPHLTPLSLQRDEGQCRARETLQLSEARVSAQPTGRSLCRGQGRLAAFLDVSSPEVALALGGCGEWLARFWGLHTPSCLSHLLSGKGKLCSQVGSSWNPRFSPNDKLECSAAQPGSSQAATGARGRAVGPDARRGGHPVSLSLGRRHALSLPFLTLALHRVRFQTRKGPGSDGVGRPQASNERVLSKEENWPQFSKCWQSVWGRNQCFSPGREAWVLGPPEEGSQVWGGTSLAEKGLGAGRKKPGVGRPGHCWPGRTIAHVQLKPVLETNLHLIFLVGPFFFFRLLTEKILKSRKLKKKKKRKNPGT